MEASPTWPPTNLSQWSMEDLHSLVDACQVEEMGVWLSGNSNSDTATPSRSSFWVALVQLVALLRLGEYGHARHVYRRWKDASSSMTSPGVPPWTDEERAEFQSWFRVGQAMMTDQLDVVWTILWEKMQVQHAEPLRSYAQEVADAYYHQRLLPILTRRFAAGHPKPTITLDPLLLGRQVPSLGLYLQAYQGWKCEDNVWKPPTTASRTTRRQPLALNGNGTTTTTTSASNKELLQLIAFLENPQLQA